MQGTGKRRSLARWLWWRAYKAVSPNGRMRVPVDTFRMWVNTKDRMVSHCLMKYGHWEPVETRVLRHLLVPGTAFVDCGANIGYYSVVAARALGDSGRVHAFEPIPENVSYLRANIAENGLSRRIAVHDVAAGEQTGALSLYIDSANDGGHSIDQTNVIREGGALEIAVRRLDDIITDDLRVSVVKIDTQGSETSILLGARELLMRHRPALLLEWWPYGLRNQGGAERLTAVLAEFGYQAAILHEGAAPRLEPTGWPELVNRYDPADPESGTTLICIADRSLEQALPASL
jgi:FkbM family methyltransferase